MRWPLILMTTLALAACGADGEPEQPTMNTSVTLSNNGGAVGTSIRRGPFSIWLGKHF